MQRLTTLLFVAALAIACDSPAPAPASGTASDVVLRSETQLVTGVVPSNTTLNAMLRQQGVEETLVQEIVLSAAKVFDPRRLRSMQPFSLTRSVTGALRAFEYEIDNTSFLRVAADTDGDPLRAEVLPIPRTLENVVASGAITGGHHRCSARYPLRGNVRSWRWPSGTSSPGKSTSTPSCSPRTPSGSRSSDSGARGGPTPTE